ncbi:MAG: YggT family protein [Coriobacteriales bacterium]|jgi:uncharacterized protein YggT (Ycf19 family)|nr:YggT family protein [Coriobacteriales bacterium]
MLVSLIQSVVYIYTILIIVWTLFSWINHSTGVANDIYQVLDLLVKPYVSIFRRVIPPMGGFDISPVIALIVLQVASGFLIRILAGILI